MTTTATVSVRIDPLEPAEVRIHPEGNQTIIVAGRVELHCDHWRDGNTPTAAAEWLRDLANEIDKLWHDHEAAEIEADAAAWRVALAALAALAAR